MEPIDWGGEQEKERSDVSGWIVMLKEEIQNRGRRTDLFFFVGKDKGFHFGLAMLA